MHYIDFESYFYESNLHLHSKENPQKIWDWFNRHFKIEPECEHKNKRYESQFTCEEIYCKDCGQYLGNT